MELDTSNNNMLDSTAFSMAFAKMPKPASTPVKQLLTNSYSSFSSNNYSSMNKRKRQDNDDGDDDDVEDMIAAAIAGKDDQNSRKKHKAYKGSDDDDEESDQASDPDDSFVKRVKQRKAAAETKKQQRWKQEMDREMKQSFETGRAIADTTYSAAVIWRAVQCRELTPDEEIIAPLIDNERAKFRALRQRNKTKYGINSNKASLEKFKDVCFAAEAVGDGKQKTRPIKRKIVIQPDSSDDEGDDKIANAKNEHKTSSAAAMDMEPEQVEAIQAESEDDNDVDGEKDDEEKEPTSMKERLANAWANNLIPDPNAHGFCWIMDNHEHKTIPFFKPSESKTVTSYEDEEWVHVMEINPADDLAVIHGQLERAWERKSDPDLYSGVKGKDKRLRSQTMRLPGLPIPRSQISILQEAKNPYDMTKQDRILDLGTSRSCQCNKTTRDGMNWRRSDGVLDTVLMIYKEAYAICKEGSYFYETFLSGKTSHQEQTLLFQSAARRTFGGSPKDCMTRNAVLGMCRGVGAGIGEKIAYAISMKYTTPKDLIHAYDACENDDEREILLAPIKLQNSKRSVATVASTMIFEGVYGRRDSDKKSGHGKVKGKSKVESIKSKNGKKASDKQSSKKKKKHKQQSEIAKKAKQKNKASNKSENPKKSRKPKRIIVSDSDEED